MPRAPEPNEGRLEYIDRHLGNPLAAQGGGDVNEIAAKKFHTIVLSCNPKEFGPYVLAYGGFLLMCEGDVNADPKRCTAFSGAGGAGLGGVGLTLSRSTPVLEKQSRRKRF